MVNKREEQLKNEIGEKYFRDFVHTDIIGSIDFAVSIPVAIDEMFRDKHYLLWAEAKAGKKANIYDSFIQLIMTIGKERTYEKFGGPQFLGAFDEEKIAFITYDKVQDVFFQNDFDWTVPPSDHTTKEFQQLKALVHEQLKESSEDVYLFHFTDADKGLEKFIKSNFKDGKKTITLREVTKSNFTFVFQKWCEMVRPSLAVDWDSMRQYGFIEAYFFLADLLSDDNKSIKEKLRVVLNTTQYILDTSVKHGWEDINRVDFNDGMRAHKLFWAHFKRPPRKEFHDLFMERIDLLVPPDIRERKGAFFTPDIWVKKSQQYLQSELGENWQDEYYIWDCCAGTGNMEAGLKNKYHIWASTLDKADVNIMHQRIEEGKLPILHEHCFQFDFLNDDIQSEKVPEDLRQIIADSEKRKKLIIYINPPYAEAGNLDFVASGEGSQKTNVAVGHSTYKKYLEKIGIAGRELYAQFFIRIYYEIPDCILAEFSTLKIVQAPNFSDFRKVFKANLLKGFLVPANTFDNVDGQFPIGFYIWDLSNKQQFIEAQFDVYNAKNKFIGTKYVNPFEGKLSINDWIIKTRKRNATTNIGYMSSRSHDMAGINYNYFINKKEDVKSARGTTITDANIAEACIFLAVCHVIEPTWLNNKDQFLHPMQIDYLDTFTSDCIAYSLFHGQNKISSKLGTNHWIPFSEEEVNAKGLFDSHILSNFIKGNNTNGTLFGDCTISNNAIVFSPLAKAVMEAGRELFKYYHSILGANRNASFYDIRAYFQGVDPKTGRMNNDSKDEKYNTLISDLRAKMKLLAKQIEVGVYKYGFLNNGEPIQQIQEPLVPPFQNELPAKEQGSKQSQLTIKSKKSGNKTVIHYHVDHLHVDAQTAAFKADGMTFEDVKVQKYVE